MENNIVVYRHVRLDTNEVFYIGIGNEKRAYSKHGRNKWWKRIVDKTDYRVDILFDDLYWEEACEKEKEFIQLYGRRNLNLGTLVNMTDGGEGTFNKKHSEDSKLKMSKSRKGKTLSDEHKLKMSEAHKGEKNHFFGQKHSEETKKKLSEAKKDKKHSEDRINNSKKSRRNIYSKKNVGVNFHTKQNRWHSKIYVDGILYYLGSFINYEDALKARKDAENLYWI